MEEILAVVTPAGRDWPDPTLRERVLPFVRWPGVWHAWQRIARAPVLGADPDLSVLEKYRQQVPAYRSMRASNLGEFHLGAIAAHAPARGRVLVAGCGSGAEAVHLARLGYAVTGIDAVPDMIEAAEALAREAGVAATFRVARVERAIRDDDTFDVVYFTPLLYSFLSGRRRRVGLLRTVAAAIRPSGCLLFSIARGRGARDRLETALLWMRRRLRGEECEMGDWYTTFLAPDGSIGHSFLHRFTLRDAIGEVRSAGLVVEGRTGADIVAVPPGVRHGRPAC